MEEDKALLAQTLIEIVNEVSSISDYRCSVKKDYCNLGRRLKLLTPMFEEIRESKEKIGEDSYKALISLKEALDSAKSLLRFGSQGSQIYLVLEREQIMKQFHEVTSNLEKALTELSYETLDISDEVKEQVELVLTQFRRAKGRIDIPDSELYNDLSSLYSNSNELSDPVVLRRVSRKLQLLGIAELTHESLALHEMVDGCGGDPGEIVEKMSMLLKKIKDFVQTENPNLEAPARFKGLTATDSGQSSSEGNRISPVIPDDFRCPISLELMKDPVIVSTGQTYEHAFIKKWLEDGHSTCPKTQQALTNTTLTPNYVLRSLIAQWCESNGIEPPKRPGSTRPTKTVSTISPAERTKIEQLLKKLTSTSPEDQRSAAGEIRLLAKRNADNRIAIAEAGAIPLLAGLLSSTEPRIQEHAVTSLLNLSICEENKESIISSGALPGIVHVLKKGSMETRENAAATLFSLSVVDENKVKIGLLGAIPPLVTLLSEGTQRGKKDAATALFNLCIYQGNKGKAVRAGIVPTLMQLLTEPEGAMVDEALAILAILSSHSEGKTAIGAAEAVRVLVEVIGNGSPRNRENAAAVLVHLCSGDQQRIAEAQDCGVMDPLFDLAQNGTERGKRKAAQLLERMGRYFEHQTQSQAQLDVFTQIQNPTLTHSSQVQRSWSPSVASEVQRSRSPSAASEVQRSRSPAAAAASDPC